MNCSRRDWCRSLPALLAAPGWAAADPSLPSKAFPFDSLKVSREGKNRFRAILQGVSHSGCEIEVHETDLAPGEMPHPPHHHVHEEMFLIREGTLEFTIAGHTTRLGAGSAAFVASNDEHGITNVGSTHAQYFVLALGNEKA